VLPRPTHISLLGLRSQNIPRVVAQKLLLFCMLGPSSSWAKSPGSAPLSVMLPYTCPSHLLLPCLGGPPDFHLDARVTLTMTTNPLPTLPNCSSYPSHQARVSGVLPDPSPLPHQQGLLRYHCSAILPLITLSPNTHALATITFHLASCRLSLLDCTMDPCSLVSTWQQESSSKNQVKQSHFSAQSRLHISHSGDKALLRKPQGGLY
jgi:hypothetical protein